MEHLKEECKDYIIGFKIVTFIFIFGFMFGFQLSILIWYDLGYGIFSLLFDLGVFAFLLRRFMEKILAVGP